MVKLEKITSDVFPLLYDAFLVGDDPLSDERDWRNVFDYAWKTDEGHCGYALLDDGVCVGMIGMVFADRWIGDARHRFCNLHTWWVREDYRSHSLMLLRPVQKLKGYTATHWTPCDKVRAISRRLGWSDVSVQLKVLLPLNVLGRRGASRDGLLFGADDVREHLGENDRRVLDDHAPYGCEHLLVTDGDETCYVLYTRVVRHRMPYCHIHYTSNRRVFETRERDVRAALFERHRIRFVAVDTRLFAETRFDRSFDFWAPAVGLYKSDDLRPEQIDNLYSDVVFLSLTTLPTIGHELRQLAGRAWSRVRRAALPSAISKRHSEGTAHRM